MEWISVSDRLPREIEKVLVINSVGIFDCGWVGLNKGKIVCRNSHSHIGNITHWMPLPEPPKQ